MNIDIHKNNIYIKNFLIIALLLAHVRTTLAYVSDNRYLPYIKNPFLFHDERKWHGAFELFAMTASRGFGGGIDEIGIPDLVGEYDQRQYANALIEAGISDNPLFPVNSLVNSSSEPWTTQGKIQVQGGLFIARWNPRENIFVEFAVPFMRVHTNQFYFLKQASSGVISQDELDLLNENRRAMNNLGGLTANSTSTFGVGDCDLAFRYGNSWEYTLKFRKIDTGIRLGTLLPTSQTRTLQDTFSIPFAGNGHWAVYGAVDAEFELKQDLKAGLYGYGIKRLARTQLGRMPSLDEPLTYGTLLGSLRTNPGFTFIFAPYVQKEALRGGLAARLQYTIMHHMQDSYTDEREEPTVPAHFCRAEGFSRWSAEIVTVTVLYDFGRTVAGQNFLPVVYGSWDIPVGWYIANRASKTYRAALGIELNF